MSYVMSNDQAFRGGFAWVGYLVVCCLYKISRNPPTIVCCGKKWPKCHFVNVRFLGLGWP